MNCDSGEEPKNSFDCGSDRTDVDQALRGDDVHILCLMFMRFPNHTLHTGETDAELVLEQFAYRTDTAVAQVVDVVDCCRHRRTGSGSN